MCEIRSQLHKRQQNDVNDVFEQISHIVPLFLLLTLNK